MTPTRRFITAPTGIAVAAAALAMSAPRLGAQTAPTKPVATPPSIVMPAGPAAKAAPKTLGGKSPMGKMLTREELRTCLKRLDAVNATTKDLEQRRAALDREKDDLVNSGDALKAERAEVDTKLAAVREWEGRMRAHAAVVHLHRFVVDAGGCDHAVVHHRLHHLLMLGVVVRLAQGELVQEIALVDDHEPNRFAGLHRNGFGFIEIVLHDDGDGAGSGPGLGGVAEGKALRRTGQGGPRPQERKAENGGEDIAGRVHDVKNPYLSRSMDGWMDGIRAQGSDRDRSVADNLQACENGKRF